jgi:23S rRNA U2552 (ribose-2'-O)-methylase RlmE/FtsJ
MIDLKSRVNVPTHRSSIMYIGHPYRRQATTLMSERQRDTTNGALDTFSYHDQWTRLHCDKDEWFSHPQFSSVRSSGDLCLRGGFINRAAVKLAQVFSALPPPFSIETFVDLCGGPGGFTQWLQKRFPLAHGWGISLNYPAGAEEASLRWNVAVLDCQRFKIYNGSDGTGDLFRHGRAMAIEILCRPLVNFTSSAQGSRVDFVMADGGQDTKHSAQQQESLCRELIREEIFVGVSVLRRGGWMYLKVFETIEPLSCIIMFLVCQCFKQCVLVKPEASRAINTERYLVCQDRLDDGQCLEAMNALKVHHQTPPVLTLDCIPMDFIHWLRMENDQLFVRHQKACNDLIDRLKKSQRLTPPNKRNQHTSLPQTSKKSCLLLNDECKGFY